MQRERAHVRGGSLRGLDEVRLEPVQTCLLPDAAHLVHVHVHVHAQGVCCLQEHPGGATVEQVRGGACLVVARQAGAPTHLVPIHPVRLRPLVERPRGRLRRVWSASEAAGSRGSSQL
jgi:hypothetical protein